MVRGIAEILDEMIRKKESTPGLAGLTSDSNVAVWRLLFYVTAWAMHSFEVLRDIFRTEVDADIAAQKVHTRRWYRDEVLKFLYGKPLIWSNNRFRYPDPLPNEDYEALRVVKQAAVVEAPNELLIKVAGSSNGDLIPLLDGEATAVGVYMNMIKDAGTNIRIVNLPADVLKINLIVIVDPLVINLDNGTLKSAPSLKPIEIAANEYINEENMVNFNGDFVITDFVDSLQKAEGVVNPNVVSIEARHGSLPFEPVDISYRPVSGYHEILHLNVEYRSA